MGRYSCPAAKAATTYAPLEEDFETLASLKELPPSVQSLQRDLIDKHDGLLDCVDNLRTLTNSYHEALQSTMQTYAVMEMAPSHSSDAAAAVAAGDAGLPSELADMLRQRMLLEITNGLVAHSSAALEISSQLRSFHADGSLKDPHHDAGARSNLSAAASELCGTGEGGDLSPGPRRQAVSCVPIFTYGTLMDSDIDVTRLLQKICKYRDDDEIEEGLCSRLSSVAPSALSQVELLLPALANTVLHAEEEMVYLTRELVRMCT
eukprot:CAMPEP_0181311640 /NCGR_PEP_ID=MMETSP1101-20121128/13253_1 /TAXON_ID=46948 /ORGANISM="Rhodomonas abbreviata, Strain Caron Lab Isolate" /LENGTH=262 /DNA_ID=CAMNT_0023418401 /DNA_START=364 /DNA_END=1149 /DNA_ORIENTATION=-